MLGKLITFTGIECCGKTTQIEKLADKLRDEQNIDVLVTKEPGGTALGETLRRILKHPQEVYYLFNQTYASDTDFTQISPEQLRTAEAEMLMFFAARAEFINHVVIPAREKGTILIVDRYADCTQAYQGGGRFHSDHRVIAFIERVHDLILQGNTPDITFFLDIPIEFMNTRMITRGKPDYMESLGKEFFERTIKEYREIARRNPKRVVTIDGTASIDHIFYSTILPRTLQLFR